MKKCKAITLVSTLAVALPLCPLASNAVSDLPLATPIPPRLSAARRSKAVADAKVAVALARRDSLILENLPLARIIALRMHKSVPTFVDLDDMAHAGVLGLIDAASKYDVEKQVGFPAYAKHRIRGAILDSLRQLDWASRDVRRHFKQMEVAVRDLTACLQRLPSEEEIAQRLGIDVHRLRTIMLDSRNVGLISASTRGGEDESLPAPDYPDTIQGQPDWIYSHNEMRDTLGEAMKGLPDRYQQVVLSYYSKNMTMHEIGAEMGINESRVSQIHKSCLEKMATTLKSVGITTSRAM